MIYLVILLIGVAVWFFYNSCRLISGYGAKTVCTNIFLCGRELEDIVRNELGSFPLSLGRFSIDRQNFSVTGKVFGIAEKKAIYHPRLGATLVNGITEAELRLKQHHYKLADTPAWNHEDISWPVGNKIVPGGKHKINSSELEKAIDEAFIEPAGEVRRTRAVLVVYDGELVAERYAPGFTKDSKLPGWSMAKSVNNALLGILVKQQKLDVDAPAPINEWKQDRRRVLTIKHLAQMSSGLSWWEYYKAPSDVTNMLYNERGMGEFALQKKLRHKPGKKFNYSSGSTNILSYIIRNNINADDYHRFPYEELFYKAGMFNTVLETDANGTFVGSSYCYSTARDWARFGLLYLNDGVVNGERILPAGWVDFTTTPTSAISKKDEGRYGALWWLNKGYSDDPKTRKYPDVPEDCFRCQGHEGQYIWVIPSEKLVVVRLALEKNKSLDPNIFLPRIIRAFH